MLKKYIIMTFCATGFGAMVFAPSHAMAQACAGGPALSGSFGLFVNGSTASASGPVGKFIVGQVSFNGACRFSGTVSYGENNAVGLYTPITGSYNQQVDGSYAISFMLPGETAAETYEVGYSPIASEAIGNESDKSGVSTIDFQALSTTGAKSAYTNASLKGTWTISCLGLSGSYSDLNYQVFDGTTSAQGVGSIGGTDYYNNFAAPGVGPYSGSYATLANGQYGGALTVGGEAFGFTGVLTNNANEIQFIYLQQTANTPFVAVTGCTGKRIK
jgi:hypothetical protein